MIGKGKAFVILPATREVVRTDRGTGEETLLHKTGHRGENRAGGGRNHRQAADLPRCKGRPHQAREAFFDVLDAAPEDQMDSLGEASLVGQCVGIAQERARFLRRRPPGRDCGKIACVAPPLKLQRLANEKAKHQKPDRRNGDPENPLERGVVPRQKMLEREHPGRRLRRLKGRQIELQFRVLEQALMRGGDRILRNERLVRIGGRHDRGGVSTGCKIGSDIRLVQAVGAMTGPWSGGQRPPRRWCRRLFPVQYVVPKSRSDNRTDVRVRARLPKVNRVSLAPASMDLVEPWEGITMQISRAFLVAAIATMGSTIAHATPASDVLKIVYGSQVQTLTLFEEAKDDDFDGVEHHGVLNASQRVPAPAVGTYDTQLVYLLEPGTKDFSDFILLFPDKIEGSTDILLKVGFASGDSSIAKDVTFAVEGQNLDKNGFIDITGLLFKNSSAPAPIQVLVKSTVEFEPATLTMFGSALVGIGILRRRRTS